MLQFVSRSLGAALLVSTLLAGGGASAEDAAIAEKVKLCVTCHGETGVPINKETPIIFGQNQGYMILQLRDYKSGSRKNALMEPVVAQLERDEIMALAAYFAKQKWPDLQQPSAPADVAAKAQTAAASIGCKGCHLDQYQGDGTTARLAGQQRDYLQATMMAFRDRSRGNNPGMSDLMKSATPEELEALAEYLAGLQINR